jgi:hypothetical protein
LIPSPALDGARVLWRHWATKLPAAEGWLREFSSDGLRVRICLKQNDRREAGTWHLCRELRIEAVLNEASAPDPSPRDDR